jgi:hypothetical protein
MKKITVNEKKNRNSELIEKIQNQLIDLKILPKKSNQSLKHII